MNFFKQVGLQAGYNSLQQIQTDEAQADVALKQQQVAQGKMTLLMNGQIMQARAQVAKDAAAGISSDKSAVDDPVSQSQSLLKQAPLLDSAGDFEGAKARRDTAKSLLDQSKEAKASTAAQVQQAKDSEASAARAKKAVNVSIVNRIAIINIDLIFI